LRKTPKPAPAIEPPRGIRARRLGYLSGAPRVSTHRDAEASGPRSHILGVVSAFRALGWQVDPFIIGDRMPSRVARDSERLLTRGLAWALLADAGRLGLRAVNSRRAWKQLGHRVDWVYERFAAFQALGQPFRAHGIPWILETQGPFYEEAKTDRNSLVLTRLARRLELAAYRSCDAIVCVSQALKEIIVRDAELEPEKVLVVPNGVDTSVFDPERHPPHRCCEGFTVVYVGSLIGWQGIDLLLTAMRELSDENGIDINLVIVGDGPMRARWEAMTQRLQLRDQVRFLGRVPHSEVPSLIAGGEIGFAGHSDRRGGQVYHSPLKLYEYLAMGKPVVASMTEDSRAIVREGQTGFLFEPGNPVQLKLALRRAYATRRELNRYGPAARRDVLTRHGWQARVQTIVRGVEDVLGHRS
jgi:glycosyltransferase involved in cell wall biosynthesis